MQKEENIARTTFKLPKTLLKDAKRYALEHDMTETDVFNKALTEFLMLHEGNQ